MLLAASANRSEGPAAADPAARPPRRAATAMEYLVVASFILVALIFGVQHLSTMTRDLMQHNADATSAISGDTGR
jgi:Flp pilus assembly pilin Flp